MLGTRPIIMDMFSGVLSSMLDQYQHSNDKNVWLVNLSCDRFLIWGDVSSNLVDYHSFSCTCHALACFSTRLRILASRASWLLHTHNCDQLLWSYYGGTISGQAVLHHWLQLSLTGIPTTARWQGCSTAANQSVKRSTREVWRFIGMPCLVLAFVLCIIGYQNPGGRNSSESVGSTYVVHTM